MKGARLDTRAAQLMRTDAGPLSMRFRDAGVLLAKAGVALLIAAFNSAIWVLVVMFVGNLIGTEFTTRFLTIFGLSIMAVSFIGLSALMLERR